MNERENASEKMVGICIERTHTRIAMNKRENMRRQLLFFVISNRRNKLIEFQFVELSKLIVII